MNCSGNDSTETAHQQAATNNNINGVAKAAAGNSILFPGSGSS